MIETFLFYDIETTGLNKAFDQILQFAAIRTDRQLNEIERHTVTVKLRPDVTPSPAALLTHRIPINAYANGLCEFEAMQQIHSLMNQPGTISLGYNSLGFDDEFIRFSFHRNLLPPYTHQYRNGCRRMDLFPITIIFRCYQREVLDWPVIDGKLSLKLEHLGAANRLASGRSHDAMVDVAATVELARRFYKKQKIWRYLEGYFDKETDAYRMEELPVAFQSAAGDHRKALMVGGGFGVERNYQAPLISIGTSIPYPNQTLWLRMDLPPLRETTAASIAETTWVIRKRAGEPGILLPPHSRYWSQIGNERNAIFDENLKWLLENHDVFLQIVKYHREYRYPFIPNLDPDASLYQAGFYSRTDEDACRRFHLASLTEKVDLIERFSSRQARTLSGRVFGRNYPANIPPACVPAFNLYMQRVNPRNEADALVDYRSQLRTTPVGALREIEDLKQAGNLTGNQLELLKDLENYLREKFDNRSPENAA